jgi:hypothetical protein
VRRAKLCRRLRLAIKEPDHSLRFVRSVLHEHSMANHLDSGRAREHRVLRAPHFSHAAHAQLLD